MTSRVHIIGAGLAGLSAAVALTEAGRTVTIYEAAQVAGGRCRSYFDRELGLRVDNGNHLLLTGNRAAFAFLETVGGLHALGGPAAPDFPFMDLASGERWTLRMNEGRVPWWIFSPSRRVPGTGILDYLALGRLLRIRGDTPVATALPHGALYHRLVEPLAVAALNTPPDQGLARLLAAVVRETLLRGGAACIPRFPREGLAACLIDPAVTWLLARGAAVQFGRRIAALRIEGDKVVGLRVGDESTPVGPGDAVVLAVPPWVAQDLLPGTPTPTAFEAILNIHFGVTADVGPAGFIGLIGGTAEWVFGKSDHISVTISAANRLVDQPAEAIAAAVWPDVSTALRLPQPTPPSRVVKERRATFAATAEQERLRPGPRTVVANLTLAGDWTATGLPATIEGAIRSGRRAAEVILGA
jgi:squalene-associated FAD-dependent desaturase